MRPTWSGLSRRTGSNRASAHRALAVLDRHAPDVRSFFADEPDAVADGTGRIKFTLLQRLGRLDDDALIETARTIARGRLSTAKGVAVCRAVGRGAPGYGSLVRRVGQFADALVIESDAATVARVLRDVAACLDDDDALHGFAAIARP